MLVALSVSTLLTGVLLYGIGALRLGQWLRFIPYPVIGGFLAASGILLITGGIGGGDPDQSVAVAVELGRLSTRRSTGRKFSIGLLFAVSIPLLGRWIPDYLALAGRVLRLSWSLLDGSLFGLSRTKRCGAPGFCRVSAS